MNEPESLLQILRTGLPSERAAAAEVLKTNPDALSDEIILSLVTREPVLAVRRALEQARRVRSKAAHDVTAPAAPLPSDVVNASARDRLRDLAGMISHETEPAIGWMRRSAAAELRENFTGSEIDRSIESLRGRLEGLALLAEASRPLSITTIDLASAVARAVDDSRRQAARVHLRPLANPVKIATDNRVLDLILSNALRNALEACAVFEGDQNLVLVEAGSSQSEFWLTVRNRFDGASFTLDEVANTGMSTKTDHKGYGANAMRYAADRLGYSVSLSGQAGVAIFTLRGNPKK